jgi:hypothetical protein
LDIGYYLLYQLERKPMLDQVLKTELPPSFTFSQSSLQDYIDCPRRFQLRYIERLPWPAVESEPILINELRRQQGILFHRMVQQRLIGLPAAKLACPENMPELNTWWENFLMLTDLPCPARNVEVILSSNIGNYRILAKYDLVIIEMEDKVTIYDWKTSRKQPKNEWLFTRMQTRVYPSLLVRSGAALTNGKHFLPEQVSMVYWFAEFPTTPARFLYTTAQYERDWKRLSELVAEISSACQFPLCDESEKCAYCNYRSYCDRGEEAGTIEAVLSEEAGADFSFDSVEEIEF